MNESWLKASSTMLLVNLVYTIVSLVIAVGAVKFVDHFLLKKLHFEEEIQKGNIAAAICWSTLVIFVAIVVGLSLRG